MNRPVSAHPTPADDSDKDPAGTAGEGYAEVDLADAVQTITGQLDQVESLVRTLAWGVNRETGDLKAALAALTARVDELAPPAQHEPAPQPTAWVDDATAQDWQDLAGWVDWLAGTYDVQPSRAVLPCWPAHRGVAEELAALRTAWRAAATAGRANKPTDALIYWHDRWLVGCLLRLREGYQQKSCQDTHKPSRAGRSTDLDLLATACVGAAERAACAGIQPPAVDPATGEARGR